MAGDSIWKKEIRLRKRPPATAPVSTPPVRDTQPTSIWKKELRLRKPKSPIQPAAAQPVAAQPPPALVEAVQSYGVSGAEPVLESPEPEPAVEPAPAPVPERWATPTHERWSLPPVPVPEDPPGWVEPPPPGPAPEILPAARLAFDHTALEEPAPAPADENPSLEEIWLAEQSRFLEELRPASDGWAVEEAEQVADSSPTDEPWFPDEARETEEPPSFEESLPVAEAAAVPFVAEVSPEAVQPEPAVAEAAAFEEPVPVALELAAATAVVELEQPATAEPEAQPEPELEAELEPGPKAKRGRSARTKKGQLTEIVGLRIGSSQLVAALVHNGEATCELVQVARHPLARGVVVGGEVREPDALASALKAFFSEHKLPRRTVRLGIASNRIGVRVLEVPAISDPKALENAIRFRAQELLSIPINEAVLDHVLLDEVDTPEGPGRRVLIAFAHRELVDRYAEACKRAKLKLVGIDFDAFALLRAITAPVGETVPGTATVAVAIGHERTIFAVAEGDLCDYSRVLDWGGSSLTVSLARALNLSPSEAEPVKHGISFDGEHENTELTPVQLEAARDALRTELQVLSRELLASLQFYQSRPGSLAIGEILLTGGGAELRGTDAELAQLLGVPVRIADPYQRVELGKKATRFADAGSVAIAIGLGIEVD